MMAVGAMSQVAEHGAKKFCPCWATTAEVTLVTNFFGFLLVFLFVFVVIFLVLVL